MPWPKIAEISDADLGFNNLKENAEPEKSPSATRFCVRVLLLNDNGEICVIKSMKYGYMQLPGGGIENSETIEEALRRETEEEAGYAIKNIEPLGLLVENRQDKQNRYPWSKAISYVFTASPGEHAETHYTKAESSEDFAPIWIKLEDFIAEQEWNEGKKKSYTGAFANRRDLLIAQFHKNNSATS